MENTENYKNSNEVCEFGNFIFLLYKFNPLIKKVILNVDGGKARFVLSKDEFYNFIKTSCNENIAMILRDSLSYLDTYFLYNRKNNTNKMVTMKKENLSHRITRQEYSSQYEEKIDPFYSLVNQYNETVNYLLPKGSEPCDSPYKLPFLLH